MLVTTLCLVLNIQVSIANKTATVHCQDGRFLTQSVVVGNSRAANPLDRTPIGRFKVSEVVDDASGYMVGAAKFKSYQTKPNAYGVTEVGYYIHGFLPESAGQGDKAKQLQGNSIGCVRMDMQRLRFKVGNLVVVR
jgi:hypothetical protein